ncbi:cytochrome-c oxidase, cbb3-type subunit III [Sulfitobacter sabulilitoris]|uniref:Cbb3-type cytochrome c oxidase subunit n=1 Tax=Sulfitobacter sabulilitoris TaxID=2562655 RepID=A0A5S3PDD0_9RHOB|nr:cytochrome-c oxidase, cbb3-type subunit III [Sulfitobacter sabulilitoris]TMM51778.1 cytochrome-c oxidase, cbb3-type subunit III [Sulfitobacter sabulilitoris]
MTADPNDPKPAKPPVDDVTGIETTGHSWDGIEELNSPLPRWWLWTFYATVIWGIAYTVAYPAWPMIDRATTGILGYSTRAEVAADIAAFEDATAELSAQLARADLTALEPDDPLHRYAVSSGAAVFRTNCSQCHGSGAAGARGYPNLLDDDWLWGGTVEQIAYTVRHGIRNEQDPDARWSQMPAYRDLLTPDEIAQTVEYVVSLSDRPHETAQAAQGAEIFADQCSACHGEAGTGMREMGAPNLTDAIWLYGGDREALTATIANARFGVMPPWGPPRLSEAQVQAVAAYVHQLGGGEASEASDVPAN